MVITNIDRRAGPPASRDGVGAPIPADAPDGRWARGDLVRFGPRISLTGAAPVRRGWAPAHPVAGVAVAAIARRAYGRLDLLPATDDVVAVGAAVAAPRPWYRHAPAWAVVLWVGAAALIATRAFVEAPVVSVPDPLVAPAILVGHAADAATGAASALEAEVRRALRHAPEAGRLLLARARDGVVGPPDWWTVVEVDGRTVSAASSARTIAQAMHDAGVALEPEDRILVIPAAAARSHLPSLAPVAHAAPEESVADGLAVPPRAVVPRDAPLVVAPAVLARIGIDGLADAGPPVHAPVAGRIVVERATTFRVVDDGFPFQMRAAATTVEEALDVAGLPLRAADTVVPDRAAPLVNGLRVTVMRAPVVRLVDHGEEAVRSTRASTVADLLAEAGIELGPLDRVEPGLGEAVPERGEVRVIRVEEREMRQVEAVPHVSTDVMLPGYGAWAPVVVRDGQDGERDVTYRVRFEDGVETARETAQVIDLVPAFAQIVARPAPTRLQTVPGAALLRLGADGAPPPGLKFVRAVRVEATAYDPGPISTGKRPGDPGYGITATGARFAPGIVAVDPRVIPFHTRLWVPGYGFGVAADTGSDIQGRRIDVGFDTYWDAVQWGRRLVTAYVLP